MTASQYKTPPPKTYSAETSNQLSTDQKNESNAVGQRGLFVTLGSGGSSVVPSFAADGGNGGALNPWLLGGGAALGLLYLVLRKKGKV